MTNLISKFNTIVFIAVACLSASFGLLTPGVARAQDSILCGSLENHYGPFDYINSEHRRNRLPVVERHHLTRPVLALKRGETAAKPGHDLDYTLRAFPNHHQALNAAARYQMSPAGRADMSYSIECYFDRAIRFQPRDAAVRMIYGIYLIKAGKPEEARKRYEEALEINPDSSEANYNMGLLLADMGEFEEARVYAAIAYRQGFPLPGLRNKLNRHFGKGWQEDIAKN